MKLEAETFSITLLWLQQIRTSYLTVSCLFKMIEWKRVLYCSWSIEYGDL